MASHEQSMEVEGATPQARNYGILFPGPSDKGCLCINPNLGEGADSIAQLVLDRGSNQMIIRKFRQRPYAELDKESRTEREVRICQYLEDQFRNQPGPRPLFAQLRGNQDLRPEGHSRYTRVSFWEFYNVGDVEALWTMYDESDQRQPPPALIARYIWQVLTMVQSMMRLSPYVLHRDIHEGNVFVHWDDHNDSPNFILGDFGKSRRSDEAPEPTMEEYQAMSPHNQALYSTPFTGDSSPVIRSIRPPWDINGFGNSLVNTENPLEASLEDRYAEMEGGMPQELTDLIDAIDQLNAQDDEDRQVEDEQERPGFQSLADVIQQAKAAEATLRNQGPHPSTYRQVWDDHKNQKGPFTLRTYPTKYEAHRDINDRNILPPYRVVDLDDEADINEKAQDLLNEQRGPDDDQYDNDDNDDLPPPSGGGGPGGPFTPFRGPMAVTFQFTDSSPYNCPTPPSRRRGRTGRRGPGPSSSPRQDRDALRLQMRLEGSST